MNNTVHVTFTFHFLGFESDDLVPPGNDEIKDNQWLGVTVRSQGIGGKVMVSVGSNFTRVINYLIVPLSRKFLGLRA